METIERILAEDPLFKGMEGRHLQLLAESAANVRFDAGQYIFREGEASNHFYLIRHGKVALELHAAGRGVLTIQTLEAGELLGWSWLVSPYKKQFGARAVELTRAIAFDANSVRAGCEQNHEFGYELLKRFTQVIGGRLQATRLQLLDVYGIHP